MPGRPTKLSAKRSAAICESVRRGAPLEAAAKAAGIAESTLYHWRERGEAVLTAVANGHKRVQDLDAQERLAASFSEDLEKARGECEDQLVRIVSHAALGHPAEFDERGRKIRDERKPNPTMAVILLERKWPQRWGRRIHVKDDTPRQPAPVDRDAVAQHEARFAAVYADELPDIDVDNLLPTIAFDDVDGAGGNGARP